MLGQRLRRWLNIKPALGQCLVCVGRLLSLETPQVIEKRDLVIACGDCLPDYRRLPPYIAPAYGSNTNSLYTGTAEPHTIT